MADTTYGDIKTQVQYNLGRGAATEVTAQMDMWAKMAIKAICRWRDFWFQGAEATTPTVVDQQAYSLPSDFKSGLKIYILKSDKYVELEGPIGINDALRRYRPTDDGEPVEWSFDDDEFKLWPPKPDAIYSLKLDYTRYIADLSANGDTNALTIQYPDLLIAKMTAFGFRYLQEWEDAKQWDADAEQIMKDLHAAWVARVMGRNYALTPRADVSGHSKMYRSTGIYVIIK